MQTTVDSEQVRAAVRETYGRIATEQPSSGCCGTSGCCRPATQPTSQALGYSEEERRNAPDGADLGLGCGNPQAIASLKPGERVLDLGSGAGFDCFLAARSVGSGGRVVGVDMTLEMIEKARGNAAKSGVSNVEFRLGEIETLPVADGSIDVIISNCVLNLSPDKPRVLREAFRVLKPGGRIAVADIVRTGELPRELASDLAAQDGCVAGAASVEELEVMLREAGFTDIRIRPIGASREFFRHWLERHDAADYVVSS